MTVGNDESPLGPYGPTFQIIPGVQSYDWGMTADQGSSVAQFAEATDELQFEKEADKPYAEVSERASERALLTSRVSSPPLLLTFCRR